MKNCIASSLDFGVFKISASDSLKPCVMPNSLLYTDKPRKIIKADRTTPPIARENFPIEE